jgi:hypothetical protein
VGGRELVAAAAKDPREHGSGGGGPTLSATAAAAGPLQWARERAGRATATAAAGRRDERVKNGKPTCHCEEMGPV